MCKMRKMKLSYKAWGSWIGIAGIVMFSAKAVMVKLGYRYDVDAVTLLLLRMLFAMPVYAYIAFRETKKAKANPITKKGLFSIVGLGFVGYYLASYFDFYGLQFISASLERLILFVYPTLVIFITAIYFKKKPSKIQLYAILISYIGIFIAFADDLSFQGDRLWIGVTSIFLSALTYAAYLVGSGAMIPKLGAVRFTAYAMTVSCFMVIIHYLFMNDLEVFNQPWQVYAIGFAMAMVSTIIPSFLISEAIKRLGASTFAIYGSIGPISTIILAMVVLGEKIDVFQIFGTIVVIFGVSVLNIRK